MQITHFGGPEVLDVVDLPDPVPGDGEQLYEVSAAGDFADTHHRLTSNRSEPPTFTWHRERWPGPLATGPRPGRRCRHRPR